MREKYESLSLAVLKDLAKTRGLKGVSALKKADLIERMLQEDEKEVAAKAKTEEVKTTEEKKSEEKIEEKTEAKERSEENTKPAGKTYVRERKPGRYSIRNNVRREDRDASDSAEEKKTEEVADIVTDSRKAGEGSLFVAIPGERVDGHKFIPNVASQGALAVISEQKLETPPCPYILVKDSMEAIKAMAEYYMQQLNIPVVGITGSVGKTSTKETIAAVLAQKYRVLKTDANFNNELGRLAKIARPETAVITNIGWCHLENLKTRDGILQAKTEIFDHLRENGHIIINGDDDKLSTVGTVHGIKPVHFGLDEKNEYYADEIESQGFRGISCRIHTPQGSFSALIPIPGRHMVYNALAGTAVGCTYGLTLEQIKQGIETLQSVSGRFHIIETG